MISSTAPVIFLGSASTPGADTRNATRGIDEGRDNIMVA